MNKCMKKFLFLLWGLISTVVLPVVEYLNIALYKRGLGNIGLLLVIISFALWILLYLLCLHKYLITKPNNAVQETILGVLVSTLVILPPLLKLISFKLYVAIFHNPILTMFLVINYVSVGGFVLFQQLGSDGRKGKK